MKVTAISDLHGYLPKIDRTDLLLIAGDWSPLEIQTSPRYMKGWIAECFVPWFSIIPAEKIIFIAGNHDFICDDRFIESTYIVNSYQRDFERAILLPLLRKYKIRNKVEYLCNSLTKYKGFKIYGCPFVEGCRGWVFSHLYVEGIYAEIPKCNILLTHQPPMYGGVGSTIIDGEERELGSWSLFKVLQHRKPEYMFCGHIHNGDHTPQILHHTKTKQTLIQNCSIKNEDYQPTHPIITLDIPSL